MIVGAHSIIYSTNAVADREFLSAALGLKGIDAGAGWFIFGLPPSEVAVHPASRNGRHELYFLCEDINAFVNEMKEMGVRTGRVQHQTWGYLTQLALPGGGRIGVYQPLHRRPKPSKPTVKRGHHPGRRSGRPGSIES